MLTDLDRVITLDRDLHNSPALDMALTSFKAFSFSRQAKRRWWAPVWGRLIWSWMQAMLLWSISGTLCPGKGLPTIGTVCRIFSAFLLLPLRHSKYDRTYCTAVTVTND